MVSWRTQRWRCCSVLVARAAVPAAPSSSLACLANSVERSGVAALVLGATRGPVGRSRPRCASRCRRRTGSSVSSSSGAALAGAGDVGRRHRDQVRGHTEVVQRGDEVDRTDEVGLDRDVEGAVERHGRCRVDDDVAIGQELAAVVVESEPVDGDVGTDGDDPPPPSRRSRRRRAARAGGRRRRCAGSRRTRFATTVVRAGPAAPSRSRGPSAAVARRARCRGSRSYR